MSACTDLICSQLLVPLAMLASGGQAKVRSFLGMREGRENVWGPTLPWPGCRRGWWCSGSKCTSASSQCVTLGWVCAQVAFCPTLCILTSHETSWHCTRRLNEERKLSPEGYFSLLWLCLAFVFAFLMAHITMLLHPADGKEFLLGKTLRCTLQSTWLAKVVVREKATKQHNICCTYWKVWLVFYKFWTRTVGDFFISDEFKWCSMFAPLRHSVPCVQGQNSTIWKCQR